MRLQGNADRVAYTPFGGGMDLITPATQIQAGRLLACINYECPIEGGYRAVDGYTRLGDAVPGVGPILGVQVFNDEWLAIREKDTGGAALYRFDGDVWEEIGDGMPVGRYQFDTAAFKATADSRELYMQAQHPDAKPWRYDGDVLEEIADAPAGARWIIAHASHLFLGYGNGSLQWSALGNPDDWTVIEGAGELGVSDNITGLSSTTGGVLVIFCRDSIHLLYGSSQDDFELRRLSSNAGAKPYSIADMVVPFFVSDRGMTNLSAVEQFGDFKIGDWGRYIEPFFTNGTFTPHVSIVSKVKNQYRVFDEDGNGVYAAVGGDQLAGVTLVQFAHKTMAMCDGEMESGEEVALFGDEAGHIYRLDTGDSFAGEDISSVMTTAFNHMGSPTARKRFRRVYLDINPSLGEVQFNVLPLFDAGATEIARHRARVVTARAQGGLWGVARWDEFTWSSVLFDRTGIQVSATATSMALLIQSTRNGQSPHTITGYTAHFTPRRLRRD